MASNSKIKMLNKGIALFIAVLLALPTPGYSARQVATHLTEVRANLQQDLSKTQPPPIVSELRQRLSAQRLAQQGPAGFVSAFLDRRPESRAETRQQTGDRDQSLVASAPPNPYRLNPSLARGELRRTAIKIGRMEWFPGVDKIKYEGPNASPDKLAFEWYDEDAVIGGKTMAEWLNFSVAAWHLNNSGADPFDNQGTKQYPWSKGLDNPNLSNEQRVAIYKQRVDAMFELMAKLGIKNYAFHDRDLAPMAFKKRKRGGQVEIDVDQTNKNLDEIADHIQKRQKETGVKLLWGTANLFSYWQYTHGAGSAPDFRVVLAALGQVKKALEVTHKLGAKNYVLWGGREGYHSLLNTKTKEERRQLAMFFRMVRDHAREIGFLGNGGKLLIEPKPHEPTGEQWDRDVRSVLDFLRETYQDNLGRPFNLYDDFALNVETNHATLAGHNAMHEFQMASDAGKLWSIDANSGGANKVGGPINNWDTDMFPGVTDALEAMLVIVKQGGFPGGGVHFDAKTHRTSTDLNDTFHAHILGMDSFAKGLIIAFSMLGDPTAQDMLKKRYNNPEVAAFKAKFLDGAMSMAEAAALDRRLPGARKKSARLEVYERFLEHHRQNALVQFMAAQARRLGHSGKIARAYFAKFGLRIEPGSTVDVINSGALGVFAGTVRSKKSTRSEVRNASKTVQAEPGVVDLELLKGTGHRWSVGFGLSTQGAVAILVSHDPNNKGVIASFQESYADLKYAEFKSPQGHDTEVNAANPDTFVVNPLMGVEAYENLHAQIRKFADDNGLQMSNIRSIGSGDMQHALVGLSAEAKKGFDDSSGKSMRQQMEAGKYLAVPVARIWKNKDTAAVAEQLTAKLGGKKEAIKQTGSPIEKRFAAATLELLRQTEGDAFDKTDSFLTWPSFITFLSTGNSKSPWSPGEAVASNLVNPRNPFKWASNLTELIPGLQGKLPKIKPTNSVVGKISPYLVKKFGYSKNVSVSVSEGDNPADQIGLALNQSGRSGASFGTSGVLTLGISNQAELEEALRTSKVGNIMGTAFWQKLIKLICFQNSGTALKSVRDEYIKKAEVEERLRARGVSGDKEYEAEAWKIFTEEASKTQPGNDGAIMIMQDTDEEVIPIKHRPGQPYTNFKLESSNRAQIFRAAMEGQVLLMKLVAQRAGIKVKAINFTGGESKNPIIRQIMADVFGVPVYVLKKRPGVEINSTAFGAAINAAKAEYDATHKKPMSWPKAMQDLVVFEDQPTLPANAGAYETLYPKFQALVQDAETRSELRQPVESTGRAAVPQPQQARGELRPEINISGTPLRTGPASPAGRRSELRKVSFLPAVETLLRGLNYPDLDEPGRHQLVNLIKDFQIDMAAGLSGKESSLAMFPSFASEVTGQEAGEFLAIDFGGSNLRILKVALNPKGKTPEERVQKIVQSASIPARFKKGKAKELFDFIAGELQRFIQEQKLDPEKTWNLGFTFSFPIDQRAIDKGFLKRWDKGYQTKGVVGKDVDVVELLRKALKRNKIRNVAVKALINDTVGTQATAAYLHHHESFEILQALIAGSGHNGSSLESVKNGRPMYFNHESGGFKHVIRTLRDWSVDQTTGNTNEQRLEKLTSGLYLGLSAGASLQSLVKQNVLFQNANESGFPVIMRKPFETAYMHVMAEDKSPTLEKVRRILKDQLNISGSTLPDRQIVQAVVQALLKRSARLYAAEIVAVHLRHDPDLENQYRVAIDGGLYENSPYFRKQMVAALQKMLGLKAKQITLELTKDGSGVGAAIIAATLSSSRSETRQQTGDRDQSLVASAPPNPYRLNPSLARGEVREIKFDTEKAARLLGGLLTKDPNVWDTIPSEAERQDIVKWLGWAQAPKNYSAHIDEIEAFASEIKARGIKNVVLIGTGGSLWGAKTIIETLPKKEGYPRFIGLDLTDPGAIDQIEKQIGEDVKETLFIVASKSGTTMDALLPYRHFRKKLELYYGLQKVPNVNAEVASHFVVITDPGKTIDGAGEDQFLRTFRNDPEIGGRYSALSYFGLVPAALVGVDIRPLLNSALRVQTSLTEHPSEEKTLLNLTEKLLEHLNKGRDKWVFRLSKNLLWLGPFLQQLFNESLGKSSHVPMVSFESSESPEPFSYPVDHLIIEMKSNFSEYAFIEPGTRAGRLVITVPSEAEHLGDILYSFEALVSLLGYFLGVHPFNQPGVEGSKEATRQLLQGKAASEGPAFESEGVQISMNEKLAAALGQQGMEAPAQMETGADVIGRFLGLARPNDYVGILAYTYEDDRLAGILEQTKAKIRNRLKVSAMSGIGPRFEHSDGQIYGEKDGLLVIFTFDTPEGKDIQVPGEKFTFGELTRAKAHGNFKNFEAKGRRVIRVHLPASYREHPEGIFALFSQMPSPAEASAGRRAEVRESAFSFEGLTLLPGKKLILGSDRKIRFRVTPRSSAPTAAQVYYLKENGWGWKLADAKQIEGPRAFLYEAVLPAGVQHFTLRFTTDKLHWFGSGDYTWAWLGYNVRALSPEEVIDAKVTEIRRDNVFPPLQNQNGSLAVSFPGDQRKIYFTVLTDKPVGDPAKNIQAVLYASSGSSWRNNVTSFDSSNLESTEHRFAVKIPEWAKEFTLGATVQGRLLNESTDHDPDFEKWFGDNIRVIPSRATARNYEVVSGKHILIADDELGFSRALAQLFENYQAKVKIQTRIKDVPQMLQPDPQKPPVDLLILKTYQGKGLEVAEAIRKDHPAIPIIVMDMDKRTKAPAEVAGFIFAEKGYELEYILSLASDALQRSEVRATDTAFLFHAAQSFTPVEEIVRGVKKIEIQTLKPRTGPQGFYEQQLDLLHPTFFAAQKVMAWIHNLGDGNNFIKNFADGTATYWLRKYYNKAIRWLKGEIVIGEGERDEAPMLFIGEHVGAGFSSPTELPNTDIAVDVVELTNGVGRDAVKGSVSIAAYARTGGLTKAPDIYLSKWVVGPQAKGSGISVEKPTHENLNLIAKATGKSVSELKGAILLRPAHIKRIVELVETGIKIDGENQALLEQLIDQFRHLELASDTDRAQIEKALNETYQAMSKKAKEVGILQVGNLFLLADGDLTPAFALMTGKIDFLTGRGGAPEGVLVATIVRAIGGEMSARFASAEALDEAQFRSDLDRDGLRFSEAEKKKLKGFGFVEPGKEAGTQKTWQHNYSAEELAPADDYVVIASAVKDNPWVPGLLAPVFDPKTGDVTVYSVRATSSGEVSIFKITYKTLISAYASSQSTAGAKPWSKNEDDWYNLGLAYLAYQRFDDAVEAFSKAELYDSKGSDYYEAAKEHALALKALLTGRDPATGDLTADFLLKAAVYLEKAVSLSHPMRDPRLQSKEILLDLYEFLGDQAEKKSNFPLAFEYYTKVVQREPENKAVKAKWEKLRDRVRSAGESVQAEPRAELRLAGPTIGYIYPLLETDKMFSRGIIQGDAAAIAQAKAMVMEGVEAIFSETAKRDAADHKKQNRYATFDQMFEKLIYLTQGDMEAFARPFLAALQEYGVNSDKGKLLIAAIQGLAQNGGAPIDGGFISFLDPARYVYAKFYEQDLNWFLISVVDPLVEAIKQNATAQNLGDVRKKLELIDQVLIPQLGSDFSLGKHNNRFGFQYQIEYDSIVMHKDGEIYFVVKLFLNGEESIHQGVQLDFNVVIPAANQPVYQSPFPLFSGETDGETAFAMGLSDSVHFARTRFPDWNFASERDFYEARLAALEKGAEDQSSIRFANRGHETREAIIRAAWTQDATLKMHLTLAGGSEHRYGSQMGPRAVASIMDGFRERGSLAVTPSMLRENPELVTLPDETLQRPVRTSFENDHERPNKVDSLDNFAADVMRLVQATTASISTGQATGFLQDEGTMIKQATRDAMVEKIKAEFGQDKVSPELFQLFERVYELDSILPDITSPMEFNWIRNVILKNIFIEVFGREKGLKLHERIYVEPDVALDKQKHDPEEMAFVTVLFWISAQTHGYALSPVVPSYGNVHGISAGDPSLDRARLLQLSSQSAVLYGKRLTDEPGMLEIAQKAPIGIHAKWKKIVNSPKFTDRRLAAMLEKWITSIPERTEAEESRFRDFKRAQVQAIPAELMRKMKDAITLIETSDKLGNQLYDSKNQVEALGQQIEGGDMTVKDQLEPLRQKLDQAIRAAQPVFEATEKALNEIEASLQLLLKLHPERRLLSTTHAGSGLRKELLRKAKAAKFWVANKSTEWRMLTIKMRHIAYLMVVDPIQGQKELNELPFNARAVWDANSPSPEELKAHAELFAAQYDAIRRFALVKGEPINPETAAYHAKEIKPREKTLGALKKELKQAKKGSLTEKIVSLTQQIETLEAEIKHHKKELIKVGEPFIHDPHRPLHFYWLDGKGWSPVDQKGHAHKKNEWFTGKQGRFLDALEATDIQQGVDRGLVFANSAEWGTPAAVRKLVDHLVYRTVLFYHDEEGLNAIGIGAEYRDFMAHRSEVRNAVAEAEAPQTIPQPEHLSTGSTSHHTSTSGDILYMIRLREVTDSGVKIEMSGVEVGTMKAVGQPQPFEIPFDEWWPALPDLELNFISKGHTAQEVYFNRRPPASIRLPRSSFFQGPFVRAEVRALPFGIDETYLAANKDKMVPIFISGGEGPGVNDYFAAAAEALAKRGLIPVAVQNGIKGFIGPDLHKRLAILDTSAQDMLRGRGGALAGTSRVNLLKEKLEDLDSALANMNGFYAFLAIGGGDHAVFWTDFAKKLEEKFAKGELKAGETVQQRMIKAAQDIAAKMIVVYKTIDGDVMGQPMGYYTAVRKAQEFIYALATTNAAMNKVIVAPIMGATVGRLALSAGSRQPANLELLATSPWAEDSALAETIKDYGHTVMILTPEIAVSLQQVLDEAQRIYNEKKSLVVVVSEGFQIHPEDPLLQQMARSDGDHYDPAAEMAWKRYEYAGTDAHGNKKMNEIDQGAIIDALLRNYLKKAPGKPADVRKAEFVGFGTGRGPIPTDVERVHSQVLGRVVGEMVARSQFQRVVFFPPDDPTIEERLLQHWRMGPAPNGDEELLLRYVAAEFAGVRRNLVQTKSFDEVAGLKEQFGLLNVLHLFSPDELRTQGVLVPPDFVDPYATQRVQLKTILFPSPELREGTEVRIGNTFQIEPDLEIKIKSIHREQQTVLVELLVKGESISTVEANPEKHFIFHGLWSVPILGISQDGQSVTLGKPVINPAALQKQYENQFENFVKGNPEIGSLVASILGLDFQATVRDVGQIMGMGIMEPDEEHSWPQTAFRKLKEITRLVLKDRFLAEWNEGKLDLLASDGPVDIKGDEDHGLWQSIITFQHPSWGQALVIANPSIGVGSSREIPPARIDVSDWGLAAAFMTLSRSEVRKLNKVEKLIDGQTRVADQRTQRAGVKGSVVRDGQVNSRTFLGQDDVRAPLSKNPAGLLESLDSFRAGNIGGKFGHLNGDLEGLRGTLSGPQAGVFVHDTQNVTNGRSDIDARFGQGLSLANTSGQRRTFGHVTGNFAGTNNDGQSHGLPPSLLKHNLAPNRGQVSVSPATEASALARQPAGEGKRSEVRVKDSSNDIRQEILNAIKKQLGQSKDMVLPLEDSANLGTVEMDSLDIAAMVTALEGKFNIKISDTDLEKLQPPTNPFYGRPVGTLKEWIDLIDAKVNPRAEVRQIQVPEEFLGIDETTGTNGWRTSVDPNGDVTKGNFNLYTLGRMAQSWADHLKSEGLSADEVVPVGFDNRPNSDVFALLFARVLKANGIKVLFSTKATTSPAQIRMTNPGQEMKVRYGFLITASHNSPFDNGIKFYKEGTVMPDTEAVPVTKRIKTDYKSFAEVPLDKTFTLQDGEFLIGESLDASREHYKNHFPQIAGMIQDYAAKTGVWLIVDQMHGSSAGLAEYLRDLHLEVIEDRTHPMSDMWKDETFRSKRYEEPGKGPVPFRLEPKEIFLHERFQEFKTSAPTGSLYFAIDGDADRLAVWIKLADGRVMEVAPNDLGVLYGWMIIQDLLNQMKPGGGQQTFFIDKTQPTTAGMDFLVEWANQEAKKRHLNVEFKLRVTPVGSKHFEPEYKKGILVIGVEESGHIVIKDFFDDAVGQLHFLLKSIAASGRMLNQTIFQAKDEVGKAVGVDLNSWVYQRVNPEMNLPFVENFREPMSGKVYDRGDLKREIASGQSVRPEFVFERLKTALGVRAADIVSVRMTTLNPDFSTGDILLADYLARKAAGETLPVIKADEGMIVTFKDRSWMQIRVSGTEGVVRDYSEAPTMADVVELQKAAAAAFGIEIKFTNPDDWLQSLRNPEAARVPASNNLVTTGPSFEERSELRYQVTLATGASAPVRDFNVRVNDIQRDKKGSTTAVVKLERGDDHNPVVAGVLGLEKGQSRSIAHDGVQVTLLGFKKMQGVEGAKLGDGATLEIKVSTTLAPSPRTLAPVFSRAEVRVQKSVEQRVKDIIIKQLGVQADQVTSEAQFIEDLGTDSLDTVELVMEFQEAFGHEIPDEDVERLVTVGDVVKYIEDQRAAPRRRAEVRAEVRFDSAQGKRSKIRKTGREALDLSEPQAASRRSEVRTAKSAIIFPEGTPDSVRAILQQIHAQTLDPRGVLRIGTRSSRSSQKEFIQTGMRNFSLLNTHNANAMLLRGNWEGAEGPVRIFVRQIVSLSYTPASVSPFAPERAAGRIRSEVRSEVRSAGFISNRMTDQKIETTPVTIQTRAISVETIAVDIQNRVYQEAVQQLMARIPKWEEWDVVRLFSVPDVDLKTIADKGYFEPVVAILNLVARKEIDLNTVLVDLTNRLTPVFSREDVVLLRGIADKNRQASIPLTSVVPRSEVRNDQPATVLVVDDDEMVKNTTEAVLKRYGFKVVTATNGEEALTKLTGVSLLLTDFNMDSMNGAELIAGARQIMPDLKAITFSGNAGTEEVQTAMAELPDVELLGKPIAANDLVAAIRTKLSITISDQERLPFNQLARVLNQLVAATFAESTETESLKLTVRLSGETKNIVTSTVARAQFFASPKPPGFGEEAVRQIGVLGYSFQPNDLLDIRLLSHNTTGEFFIQISPTPRVERAEVRNAKASKAVEEVLTPEKFSDRVNEALANAISSNQGYPGIRKLLGEVELGFWKAAIGKVASAIAISSKGNKAGSDALRSLLNLLNSYPKIDRTPDVAPVVAEAAAQARRIEEGETAVYRSAFAQQTPRFGPRAELRTADTNGARHHDEIQKVPGTIYAAEPTAKTVSLPPFQWPEISRAELRQAMSRVTSSAPANTVLIAGPDMIENGHLATLRAMSEGPLVVIATRSETRAVAAAFNENLPLNLKLLIVSSAEEAKRALLEKLSQGAAQIGEALNASLIRFQAIVTPDLDEGMRAELIQEFTIRNIRTVLGWQLEKWAGEFGITALVNQLAEAFRAVSQAA